MAWSGDKKVLWMSQCNYSEKLAQFRPEDDDIIIAGHVAMWEDRLKADAVFMDFGYGTGVFSAGKQMGRKWVMIPFGSASPDPKYANMRTFMWGTMGEWLKHGGSIPDNEDLITDLTGPDAYEIVLGQNAGKIMMESKKDMAKRGLDSTDDGDGLCVTFAMPVKNKSQNRFDAAIDSQNQQYDPLSTSQQQRPVYNPLEEVA